MAKQLTTKERLARALEAQNDPKLADMVKKARNGYYDDYESELATPCIQLVVDLTKHGYKEMAQSAMDGEWDGTLEEGQAWMKSEEGQEAQMEMIGQIVHKA